MRQDISNEELKVRTDLAVAFRLVSHFGWDELISSHISARVPGVKDEYLFNQFGMMFHEITASSLAKVDVLGEPIDSDIRVESSLFTFHRSIYKVRPDVCCIIHLHGKSGIAVSAQRDGLLPIGTAAIIVIPHLAYHIYEGRAITLGLPEEERIAKDLGDKHMMFLRNHGTLACGPDVRSAFMSIYRLETACEIQIAALAGGRELVFPRVEVQDTLKVHEDRRKKDKRIELQWAAFRRLIDQNLPGYEE